MNNELGLVIGFRIDVIVESSSSQLIDISGSNGLIFVVESGSCWSITIESKCVKEVHGEVDVLVLSVSLLKNPSKFKNFEMTFVERFALKYQFGEANFTDWVLPTILLCDWISYNSYYLCKF